jgi:hypothetical protein
MDNTLIGNNGTYKSDGNVIKGVHWTVPTPLQHVRLAGG